MKKIFKFLVLVVMTLVLVIAYNIMRFESVQPEAFNEALPAISKNAPEHLSKAVQFATISNKINEMDVEAMENLHAFLVVTYPAFHKKVKKEIVSTHTLLYTWKGKDESLKPLLFMGHLDVVPIEESSRNEWLHKPFSGDIEDGIIYGRGTLDDKCTLIGLLEAAEILATNGFEPKHTLYFMFGQDEEIRGHQGAKLVAEKFKKEGINLEMVWDEGTIIGKDLVPGIKNEVALIGIAEKGYVSFDLTCEIAGGHSSMPNTNSSIGNLARAISHIQDHPFPYELSAPVKGFIEYIGPVSPFVNKMAFANAWLFKPLIFKSYAATGSGRALIQTTMAPTIFKAGIKDNVIPGRATAVVNCRILPGQTVQSVQAYLTSVINDSSISISPQESMENPSPVSDYNNAYFRNIGSAVKTVYPESYSTPFLMLGATDARHFSIVCDKIYKFAPFVYHKEDLPRIHGINELISIENFEKGIQIYYLAIKNLDAL